MTFSQLFKLESQRFFSNRALLLTMFGGLILYAFLYPRPYLKQIAREQPIAVINHDGSQLSRTLLRMVDATPELKIKQQVNSIAEAEQLLDQQLIGGFLVIPRHFYRDLMQNRAPTLAYAGDASYFLVYSTILQGLSLTSGTLSAKVKVKKSLTEGLPLEGASIKHTPVPLKTQAVFNTVEGYMDYVLPAVFVLILHQMMIITIGLHSGPQPDKTMSKVDFEAPLGYLFVIRFGLFLLFFAILSCFYMGPVLEHYAIHQWGARSDILALLLPFLIATAAIGLSIAAFLPKRDYAMVIGLLSSLPIVLGSGFVWPVEMMPVGLNELFDLLPAKPMVLAMLKVNQLGASFSQVSGIFTQLWIQAIGYVCLAWICWSVKRRRKHT